MINCGKSSGPNKIRYIHSIKDNITKIFDWHIGDSLKSILLLGKHAKNTNTFTLN